MALGDLLDKVKQWVGKNPDKANQGIDRGGAALKGRFAGHDSQVDAVSRKAKEHLTGGGGTRPAPGQPAPGTPAPGAPNPPPA